MNLMPSLLSVALIATFQSALALTLIPSDHIQSNLLRLSYKGIPANSYSFEGGKLKIAVKSSSSPVVIPFEIPKKLHHLTLSGEILSIPEFKNADDFILRVGPAFSGKRTLGAFDKLFAPKWITQMNSLAEKMGVGFGGLDLNLISPTPGPTWKQRKHPKSDLIHESIALIVDKTGKFQIAKEYSQSENTTLGIWIGSDGDDSKVSFDVVVEQLEADFYGDEK